MRLVYISMANYLLLRMYQKLFQKYLENPKKLHYYVEVLLSESDGLVYFGYNKDIFNTNGI